MLFTENYLLNENLMQNSNSISFNIPFVGSEEIQFLTDAIHRRNLSGGGEFTELAQAILKEQLDDCGDVLLTTSCTHALEAAAILLDLEPGDEVIVPSYTFSSTALAFTMHGARIVFIDSRQDNCNLNESLLEKHVTKKTRAIVVVHYAGVACEMDTILNIAKKHNLVVIEDNAHGLYGRYKGKPLGSIGHLACHSFHATKNITCGEGGALVINDPQYLKRAEIVLEKGTNRKRFIQGDVDKYTWVDKGSSYVLSDLLAAMLVSQLNKAREIQNLRKGVWNFYFENLADWAYKNGVKLPFIPEGAAQAYHMFYMLLPDTHNQTALMNHMLEREIPTHSHYQSLDRSDMAKKCSERQDHCPVSHFISERLLRLPFHAQLNQLQLDTIVEAIQSFKVKHR